MKPEIHPEYFPTAQVTCSCGNNFVTGSSKSELSIEICSKCHPFFTGEQRIVDTEGRVERLRRRFKLEEELGMRVLKRVTALLSPIFLDISHQ